MAPKLGRLSYSYGIVAPVKPSSIFGLSSAPRAHRGCRSRRLLHGRCAIVVRWHRVETRLKHSVTHQGRAAAPFQIVGQPIE